MTKRQSTEDDNNGNDSSERRIDLEEQVRDAFPALERITAETLCEQCVTAWMIGLERGGWEEIEAIPYAWNIHEVSTVEHIRGVTEIALASADRQREIHGADPDTDVLIAACLLHDVGKCYEYADPEDDSADEMYVADVIPHSLSSYAIAHEVGCPIAVKRAIPHFLGEIPQRTLEAELVKSANAASSNAITHATMGITLSAWIDQYSQTQL